MTEAEFKQRTKAGALRVIRLVEALPRTRTADVIGRQILRSGTSVGANYRAACRAVSTADMISKLGDVEEEADETLYWLELLGDSGTLKPDRLADLRREFDELLAMTVASRRTLRSRSVASKIERRKRAADPTAQHSIENQKP
jgi:four helix bundle protein